MPSWRDIVSATLGLFVLVFGAWAILAGVAYYRGELPVDKVLDPLWNLAMLLIGMVLQAARTATEKAPT